MTDVYGARIDPGRRGRWLADEPFEVRTARDAHSMRVNWAGGTANLAVRFFPRGPAKTRVVAQQIELMTGSEVEAIRTTWKQALGRLRESFDPEMA